MHSLRVSRSNVKGKVKVTLVKNNFLLYLFLLCLRLLFVLRISVNQTWGTRETKKKIFLIQLLHSFYPCECTYTFPNNLAYMKYFSYLGPYQGSMMKYFAKRIKKIKNYFWKKALLKLFERVQKTSLAICSLKGLDFTCALIAVISYSGFPVFQEKKKSRQIQFAIVSNAINALTGFVILHLIILLHHKIYQFLISNIGRRGYCSIMPKREKVGRKVQSHFQILFKCFLRQVP